MGVKFSKPISIEQKEIDLFSQEIGCALAEDVQKYFLGFNGAKPEANIFDVSDSNESGVNELIPSSKIVDERKSLDHVGESVYPIALAEGGNYLVIDFAQDSSVYFWDHEEPENLTLLEAEIYAFISKLKQFDPDSIELKEGQVESAWIDPDFLKSFK